MKVKSLSRVQLSDPMDYSLPGSSIHGIFQAKSIAPPHMHSLCINCRILFYCTCHFWGSSHFFACLASSFCNSLQCLIPTLTQGGKGGHLFRLTCSVVLWRRDTTNKYHWHVWGVLTLNGTHRVCHSPRWYVLPPHCSGSRVLCEGTVPSGFCILCLSKIQATQVTRCLVCALCILCMSPILATQFPRCAMRAQSQVCHVSLLGS